MKYFPIVVLILSILFNIIIYNWYVQIQTKLEITSKDNNIESIGNLNSTLLSDRIKNINNQFLENTYSLRSNADNEPEINVQYLCDQDNGISCIYYDKNNISHKYGI